MKYLALFAILFAASYGQEKEEEDDGPPYKFRTDVCYDTCVMDDNCGDVLVCVNGECVQCDNDDDCAQYDDNDNFVEYKYYDDNGNSLQYCQSNVSIVPSNVCVECVVSDDCGPALVCLPSNTCVGCDIANINADCVDTEYPYCVGTDCVACGEDAHCTDALDLCNPTTGECVDCVEDEFCLAANSEEPFCVNDWCSVCREDSDCLAVLHRAANPDYVFCDNGMCEFTCMDPVNGTECDDEATPPTICRADLFPDRCIEQNCVTDVDCTGENGPYSFPDICANDDESIMDYGDIYCDAQFWWNSPLGPFDYCFQVYNRTGEYSGQTVPDLDYDAEEPSPNSADCVAAQCHIGVAEEGCQMYDDGYISMSNPFTVCMPGVYGIFGSNEPMFGEETGICVEDCNTKISDKDYWCAEDLPAFDGPMYELSCGSDGICGVVECSSNSDCQNMYNCGSRGKCSPACVDDAACQSTFEAPTGYFCQTATTYTCEPDSCGNCKTGYLCNDDSGICIPECSIDSGCQDSAGDLMDEDHEIAMLYACNTTNAKCYYAPNHCSSDSECINDAMYKMGLDSAIANLYACNTATYECYYTPDACSNDGQCQAEQLFVMGLDLDIANLYACNTDTEECYYGPDACSTDSECQDNARYAMGESDGISSLYACNTTTAECYYTPQSCTFDDGSGPLPMPCECDEAIGDGCTVNQIGDGFVMAGDPLYRCVQVDGTEGVCVASDNCLYQESDDPHINNNSNPKWCIDIKFGGYPYAVCDSTTSNCVDSLDCRNGAGCGKAISVYTGMHQLCPDWPFEVACNQENGQCGGDGPGHVSCSSDIDCDTGNDYVCSAVRFPDDNGFPGTCIKKCSGDAFCDGLFCIDIDPADEKCDDPAISAMSCDLPTGQCIFGDDKDQCGDHKQCGKLPGGVDQICMTLIPFLPNMCYVDCSAAVASAADKTQDEVCGDAFKGRWANYADIECITIDEAAISISFCNDGKPGLGLMGIDILQHYFIGVTSAPTQSPAVNPIASATETTKDPNAGGAAQIKIFAAIVMVGVIKLFM